MFAIKIAAVSKYKKWTDQFADAGRTGFKAECPKCKEPYVVYYGPKMNEAEARKEFDDYMERGHKYEPASHAESFATGGEQFPPPEPAKK
jgi:hypothetical protein